MTSPKSLTRAELKAKFPEVYESYALQHSIPASKFDEKLNTWAQNGINCFERWTVPYFLEREKERKKPCLRLNYPNDGKCNECAKGSCRYSTVCFMCGKEGHGAFQIHSTGKLKGEYKCSKHRQFLNELETIREVYGLDDAGIRELFLDSSHTPSSTIPSSMATSGMHKKVATPLMPAQKNYVDAAGPPLGATAPPAVPAVPAAVGSPSLAMLEEEGGKNASSAASSWAARLKEHKDAKAALPSSASTPLPAPPGKAATATGIPASPMSTGDGGQLSSSYSSSSSSEPVRRPQMQTDDFAASVALSSLSGPTHASNLLYSPSSTASQLLSLDGGAADLFSSPMKELSLGPSSWSLPAPTAPGFSSLSQSLPPASALPANELTLEGLLGSAGMASMTSSMPFLPSYPAQIMPAPGLAPSSVLIDVPDNGEFAGPYSLRVFPSMFVSESASHQSIRGKGSLVASKGGAEEVSLRGWYIPTGSISSLDAKLRGEIKALRVLAGKCSHVAKIVSSSPIVIPFSLLDRFSDAAVQPDRDLLCVLSETGETLDQFLPSYVKKYPQGLTNDDLQNIAVQLLDGLIACHEQNVVHRNICPQNILVQSATSPWQSHLLCRKYLLKYTHFSLSPMLPYDRIDINGHNACSSSSSSSNLINSSSSNSNNNSNNSSSSSGCSSHNPNHSHGNGGGSHGASSTSMGTLSEIAKWRAPELSPSPDGGMLSSMQGDCWSLGLVLYYLATSGKLPFDGIVQAREASRNADLRKQCMEQHGLHLRNPMLHDLIDSLLHPRLGKYVDLKVLRCHPLMWSMDMRKTMICKFASYVPLSTGSSAFHNLSEPISQFFTQLDKLAPHIAFSQQGGWVGSMHAPLLTNVQPSRLKSEFWWSGSYLLVAVRNQLVHPESLVSAYPLLSTPQALAAYIVQITDVDFPRLLPLLYKLGGQYGQWHWDGDEVSHQWR